MFFPVNPGCFDLLQTIYINHGTAVTLFELKDQLFIVFASHRDSSSSYIHKTKLPVYVLQEKYNFILNQTLDSFRVQDVEYFTIHCDHFLVVANDYNGYSYKLEPVVYRWETGKFKEFQRIPTNGAKGTHYFTIDRKKMMSFSNNMYGSHEVSTYEWKNKQFSTKIQDIQMTFPYRCNTFTIHNITYIACGRGYGGQTVKVPKWSGKQFESFQDLPSLTVYDRPHIIHANGTVYLAIANHKHPSKNDSPDTDSFIYRWNGIKFAHHQSIPTHGAREWDSFTVAGQVFLVVANCYTRSPARNNVKSAV